MKLILVLGLAVVCTLASAKEAQEVETSLVTLEQSDKYSQIINVDKKKELDAFEAEESADAENNGQTRIKRSPNRDQLKRKLRNHREALKRLQKNQRKAKNQRIQLRQKRLNKKRQWRNRYNQWKNKRNAWVQQVKIRNEVAKQLRAAKQH